MSQVSQIHSTKDLIKSFMEHLEETDKIALENYQSG